MRGGLGARTERERCWRSRKMRVGEGRERQGRWEGGLRGEAGRARGGGVGGEGWDRGASPERQGERAGGKGDRAAAGQVVSGQHCSPASRCLHSPRCPALTLHGALSSVHAQPPAPSVGGGGGG